MAVRLEGVTFGVADAAPVAVFWAGMLDREVLREREGLFLPGDALQVGLRFVTTRTTPTGKRWLHLHLTSSSVENQQETVERALRLGGRHVDVGQDRRAPHVVLADPDGNELCVIEPGNNFLAGAGHLGEVTCDGPRNVGLFWRLALNWPLVWDEGEQTAIQSPLGGTKISWDVWGGGRYDRKRQRFDLVASDPTAEAERLVSLGATRVRALTDGVELLDPGGNALHLRDG